MVAMLKHYFWGYESLVVQTRDASSVNLLWNNLVKSAIYKRRGHDLTWIKPIWKEEKWSSSFPTCAVGLPKNPFIYLLSLQHTFTHCLLDLGLCCPRSWICLLALDLFCEIFFLKFLLCSHYANVLFLNSCSDP